MSEVCPISSHTAQHMPSSHFPFLKLWYLRRKRRAWKLCNLFFSYFLAERNKNEGKSWWNHQHEHLQRSSKTIIYNKCSHVFHIAVLFCSDRFITSGDNKSSKGLLKKVCRSWLFEGNPPTWATKKNLLITFHYTGWLIGIPINGLL